MTYQEYLDQRSKLNNEVQTMIDAGNIEDANAKMEEIKDLDTRWDTTREALDNLAALNDEQRAYDVQNLTGAEVRDGMAMASLNLVPTEMVGGDRDARASQVYVTAWAKAMQGGQLTDEEKKVFDMVNEYTHTTGNTGVVIPETVAAGIWDIIEETYPYWADVQKTYVKGQYTAIIANTSTDAKWYDEDTKTEDGTETFRTITLNGCELARAITVSWKLKEMAIDDFIPYIQRRMAKRMGAALGYGVTHGKGQPAATNTFKPEPLGVVTALEKEAGTPQVKTYTKGELSFTDIVGGRALVTIAPNEAKIYANSDTIWNELALVTDLNKRPLFISDVVNGKGVNRILGMEVKQDDSMEDGEILISAAYTGYHVNVNKEISMSTEEHVKERTTDYCGYAIVDGAVTYSQCHALLKQGE